MQRSDIASTGGARRPNAPPIGVRRGPLRFRLYAPEGTDPGRTSAADDPFISLAGGAAPFQACLAALEAEGVVLLPWVALLLQPNEYPGVRSGATMAGATNAQMEMVWREALRAWSAGLDGGVAPLETLALTGDAPPEDLPHQGPLAFCRRTGEYIEPLCPACLGPLSLCRDETLLRTCGLPSYASSLFRFLHCAPCAAAAGRSPTFYTWSARPVESLAAGVKLRRRSELYRDLATRIQVPGSSPPAQHHCFECPHRAACYPTGRNVDDPIPAEGLLFPLSYYGSFYLAVEARPFEFAETAALLGGASTEEMERAEPADLPRAGNPLRELGRRALGSDRPQFFFQGDPNGLMALEALHLKLSAFAGLARGVRDLHALAGRPHLALSPDRVRGRLSPVETLFAPARWGLSLAASDLLTTAPLVSLEAERVGDEPVVWSVPHPLPEAYVPEALARLQSESIFMRVTVRECRVEKTGEDAVARLTAELTADGYRDADHGRHDLVRLSAAAARGAERLVFAGRKTVALPRGFVFEGTTGPLAAAVAGKLEAAGLPGTASAEVTIVHSFSAPADVVSLGLLLFRLLLVNDGQAEVPIDGAAAGRIAASVAAPPGDGSAPGEAGERARLAEALAREPFQSGPEQVLHRQADRALAPPAIPGALWQDALLLSLRMATNIPGWSVCGRLDEFDPGRPSGPMDRVLAELDALIERTRGGLVGSSGRSGLVLEVCDDFLADVAEAAARGSVTDSSPGKTMVVKSRRSS